jgi:protein-disulfide isomerase
MASRKEQKEQARAERAAGEANAAAAAQRQRRIRLIGAVIGGAVVVLVIAIAINQSGNKGGDASNIAGASEVDASLSGIPQSGLVLGKRKAPVKIIEFGDLQCPACKQFADSELGKVVNDLVKPGKATLEFKNFTIIGPQSVNAAKGSLAASEQGRYWQFVELFYRNQGTENSGYVTNGFMEAVAKAAGVTDIGKWNDDLDKPAWNAELDAVQKEAARLGFSSTPSFQIEGRNGQTAVPDDSTASSIAKAVKSVQ